MVGRLYKLRCRECRRRKIKVGKGRQLGKQSLIVSSVQRSSQAVRDALRTVTSVLAMRRRSWNLCKYSLPQPGEQRKPLFPCIRRQQPLELRCPIPYFMLAIAGVILLMHFRNITGHDLVIRQGGSKSKSGNTFQPTTPIQHAAVTTGRDEIPWCNTSVC